MDEQDDIADSQDMSEKGYGYIDLTPEVSPYMQVDSGDEGMELRLFVYGVRHHHLENYTIYIMSIKTKCRLLVLTSPG